MEEIKSLIINNKAVLSCKLGGGLYKPGYQEVEWLTPTVLGAYIDTGLLGNMSHHVEIYGITANASSDNYIFGARNEDAGKIGLDLWNGRQLYAYFNALPMLTSKTGESPYIYIVDNGICREEYSGAIADLSQYAGDISCDYTYTLFALNRMGTCWAFAAPGLKLSRAYFAANDGTPLRDFVSVVRLSDSEPGMYDKVNGIFYPSNGEAFTPGEPTGRYY